MTRKYFRIQTLKRTLSLASIILICTVFTNQSVLARKYSQKTNSQYSTTITSQYSRSDYKKHWIDADHDCQNTRQEVLIMESSLEEIKLNAKGCKVIAGKWFDPYTNQYFTNPKFRC